MNVDWVDMSGKGAACSWTIAIHAFHPGFKPDLPYVLLTLGLPENVRMNAQARGIAASGPRLGLPVVLAFETVTQGRT